MIAEADRKAVAVGGFAGLAHRHHDAAPVRVLARDRGLHQRRVGDCERDALGTVVADRARHLRSEEHTSELPSLMRIPYAVFGLKKKKQNTSIRIKIIKY